MEQRIIGRSGPSVSALGLGCMSIGIADIYTSSVREDRAAVALIHRALDSGITLLDTADIYGVSEIRVGKALRGRRLGITLATKFGFVTVLVQSEMEKNIFPLVKIPPLRGGDFQGMRIHRPMPVSRSFALAL